MIFPMMTYAVAFPEQMVDIFPFLVPLAISLTIFINIIFDHDHIITKRKNIEKPLEKPLEKPVEKPQPCCCHKKKDAPFIDYNQMFYIDPKKRIVRELTNEDIEELKKCSCTKSKPEQK